MNSQIVRKYFCYANVDGLNINSMNQTKKKTIILSEQLTNFVHFEYHKIHFLRMIFRFYCKKEIPAR